MPAGSGRPFLRIIVKTIAAMDFFTVPTATFRVLYCFFVISHSRRRVLHFNATEHPTGGWSGWAPPSVHVVHRSLKELRTKPFLTWSEPPPAFLCEQWLGVRDVRQAWSRATK